MYFQADSLILTIYRIVIQHSIGKVALIQLTLVEHLLMCQAPF